jgi:flagellar biosynthetic protein FliO
MSPSSIDFTWVFLKTIFAMVAVIAVAILVIRYIIPKLTLGRTKTSRSDLQIVDRIPLDGRKSLYLIQIERKRYLLASTEHQINLISELGPANENKS